jgi:acyl dehydratase
MTERAPGGTDLGAVTLARLVRFAGASGDLNQLHYDFEFARAAGFDRPIMHGLLGGALLSGVVASARPAPPAVWLVRFRRPVLLGSTLVASVELSEDGGEANLSVDDDVVTTAQVSWEPQEPSDVAFEPLAERYQWVVEQGAVREYAAATDFPQRPGRGEPIPIMALGLCGRWSERRVSAVSSLGFDYRRMLHRQSEYRQFGAGVSVGETLWAQTGLGDRSTREARDGSTSRLGSVVTELRSDDGELRAVMSHQMLERGERA